MGIIFLIEMEGRGFLQALHANPSVSALIVRGISDLIDHKAEADAAQSQLVASRNASVRVPSAVILLARSQRAPDSANEQPHRNLRIGFSLFQAASQPKRKLCPRSVPRLTMASANLRFKRPNNQTQEPPTEEHISLSIATRVSRPPKREQSWTLDTGARMF